MENKPNINDIYGRWKDHIDMLMWWRECVCIVYTCACCLYFHMLMCEESCTGIYQKKNYIATFGSRQRTAQCTVTWVLCLNLHSRKLLYMSGFDRNGNFIRQWTCWINEMDIECILVFNKQNKTYNFES